MHKAHAEEFSDILEGYTLPSKSVSTTFVSKLVGHFISVGQIRNHIPEPSFLEVSELFGVQNWLPQPINPMAEINRIEDQEKLDTSNTQLVDRALNTSSLWTTTADFANSWFETGDRVWSKLLNVQSPMLCVGKCTCHSEVGFDTFIDKDCWLLSLSSESDVRHVS
jgi:hypothetical protein